MRKQILDERPDLELAVYAVWFDMFPGDSRGRWPADLLDDPRARHWWDEEKRAGRWFGEHPGFGGREGRVLWDAYLLFPPEARWGESGPAPVTGWGATIVENREDLRAQLDRILAEERAGRGRSDGER